jgi:hypothetical protein
VGEVNNNDLIEPTADIVAAHVSNNSVHTGELANLIGAVHLALAGLGTQASPAAPERPKDAVPARASIKSGRLVSVIDGKPYKTLLAGILRNYSRGCLLGRLLTWPFLRGDGKAILACSMPFRMASSSASVSAGKSSGG